MAEGQDQHRQGEGGGDGVLQQPELPPDHAPFDLGLLPGGADEYILTSGAFKGQRGFFTRDESDAVVGVDLAGRLFNRVPAASD